MKRPEDRLKPGRKEKPYQAKLAARIHKEVLASLDAAVPKNHLGKPVGVGARSAIVQEAIELYLMVRQKMQKHSLVMPTLPHSRFALKQKGYGMGLYEHAIKNNRVLEAIDVLGDKVKQEKRKAEDDEGAWLSTHEGREWLESIDGRGWIETEKGHTWLDMEGGREWLKTESGREWLRAYGGKQWLKRDGWGWLSTKGGWDWLKTKDGWDWIDTDYGKQWVDERGDRNLEILEQLGI